MKLASFRSLAACTLFGGALLVACSSGDSTAGDFGIDSGSASGSGGGSGGGHDSGGGFQYDSGGGFEYDSGAEQDTGGGSSSGGSSGSSSGGGGSCGACTTDSECQSACPAVSGGGTNCCDVGSGVCYATTQMTCPVPSDGGGPG